MSYPGIEFRALIANDDSTLVKLEPEDYEEYEKALLREDLRVTAQAQLRLRMLLAPLPVRSDFDYFGLLVGRILIILQAGSTVKDSLYSMLETIGYFRENGITQTDLGVALGLDSRVVFSITKRLVDYDLM